MSLRHVSGGYIEATANIPPIGGCTVCGFFTRKADRGVQSVFLLLRNSVTGHYQEVATDAANDNLIGTRNAGDSASVMAISTDAPFFAGYTFAGSGTNTCTIFGRVLTSAAMSTLTMDVDAQVVSADIFRFGEDGFGNWFDGESSGVMIFDRVLTDAELLAQSRQRTPINRVSLNRWYPENDSGSASNNVVDFSGNARNGTVVGSPTATTGALGGYWTRAKT